MKIDEIRSKSTEELNETIYSLKEKLFDLRRKKAVGQLENLSEIKRVRKEIARCYTVLKEKELGVK
ncbi:MAG: 50S ribosomal protein L29 [Bacilli bacterium]|nr:50S ribosomal protein L29 [Mollicutes bacterium]MDD6469476.1 50S ribosomal protein L29 [Bacilli bacterium]MDY2725031.1 50S ribosomal protein L29 [Candidatus Onthovivens sp.]MCI6615118.1 50S ribosomal protein L29 [Mollicutes bacterium]MCI7039796.1 50S ribosomal protein L29 [Mollicutes bacterium]